VVFILRHTVTGAILRETVRGVVGAGWEGARFLECGALLNFAGAGQERAKNFNPRRILH